MTNQTTPTMPNNNTKIIPAMATRGLVLFPGSVMHFDVGREKSIAAVKKAVSDGSYIFLIAQKDLKIENPAQKDLYRHGVIAEIKQTLKLQDGVMRVLVEGVSRAKLVGLFDNEKYLTAEIKDAPVRSPKCDEIEVSALVRTVRTLFEEYYELVPKMPKDIILNIMTNEDPLYLSNYIPANLMINFEAKQAVLDRHNVRARLEYLAYVLDNEINVLSIESEIFEKVKTQMDKGQRDYFLREQMKVIASELGDGDSPMDEALKYEEKISALKADDAVKEKLLDEVSRFSRMPSGSHEAAVVRNYLDVAINLPWGVLSKDKANIPAAEKILNRDHFGLQKVKERILESISVMKLTGNVGGNIICLVGPPGVGKTSIAKSVAEALGKKYARIALGGVRDENEIRGHRKTYIGSMPGRIISAIKSAGTSNPLILLDEIDKLSGDYKGDPSAALLEVLDSEQNKNFTDHYLDVPFDLSNVLFMTTANDASLIPDALLDRMEIISLEGYTRQEKYHIAAEHLIPKQISKNGLTKSQISFSKDAVFKIIDSYTREAGVRNLEREISSVLRKCAKKVAEGETGKFKIDEKAISELLGPIKYTEDTVFDKNECGVATGLAWTSSGGEVLPIEVSILDGSGKFQFTGSLGDVMKESCDVALSYIRSISSSLNLDKDFYKAKDIHIHAPEGAVPKDGPSAGVTICLSLVSALCSIPVRNDIAMTGEITIKGHVLPIGGLKEKAMAAHRLGIKNIIIPFGNIKDLKDLDSAVKEDINFIPVKTVSEVLQNGLSASLPHFDIKDGKTMDTVISASTINVSVAQ